MTAGGPGTIIPPTQRARARRVLVVTSAVAVVVDAATKAWATSALGPAGISFPGPLDLRLAHNRGVAFSLFNRAPVLLIVAMTGAVTVALAVAAWRGAFAALPAGLILGGAVANLIDRLVGGSVVDMLHTGWWPTFNFADVFITVGCGLLALTALRAEGDDE